MLYNRVEGKHGRVTPDCEELQFCFASEESTRLARLLTGEVHSTAGGSDLEQQAERRGMKVISSTLPHFSLAVALAGNSLPTEPQSDPNVPWTKTKVRAAMHRAMNRDAINKALGRGRVEVQMVRAFPSAGSGWNPAWPEKCKEL